MQSGLARQQAGASDAFEAETERLLSLGAWKLAERPGDRMRWATFADIEGNEFDLIAG